MRHKCSPVFRAYGRHLVLVLGIVFMAGCAGSGQTAQEGGGAAPADTLAGTAAADSLADYDVPASVPVALPRNRTDATAERDPIAVERPAYARLQLLPELSSAFVEQFAIQDASEWSEELVGTVVTIGSCSAVLVSGEGLAVTSATCLEQVAESWPVNESGAFVAANRAEERSLGGAAGRFAWPSVTHSEADVRIVFVPERTIAHFGGEHARGTFPQYRFDVAFIRLYQGDSPLATPRFLPWGARTVRNGAPTLALGAIRDSVDEWRTAVSGGRVRGFAYGATEAPAKVTLYGLFEREVTAGSQAEWTLPSSWAESRGALSLSMPISMVATNDTAPSMFGGVLLSLDRRIVGTIYDTNHAAAEEVASARVVGIPATTISSLLTTVYGATALVQELTTERPSN